MKVQKQFKLPLPVQEVRHTQTKQTTRNKSFNSRGYLWTSTLCWVEVGLWDIFICSLFVGQDRVVASFFSSSRSLVAAHVLGGM
jgi:hypothetical protein